jgi:hypothetical protein
MVIVESDSSSMHKHLRIIIHRLRHLRLTDLLAGLLLMVCLLFFLLRFSRKSELVYLELTFEREGYASNFYPPEYWQVEKIKVGDKVYNALGNQIAEVVAVKRVGWGGGARLYTYVTLGVDALYNTATKTYTHDGQQLIIGEKTNFTINNSSYTGLIKDVYRNIKEKEANTVQKNAKLTMMCRNYEEWHAQAIAELTVKDSDGKVWAEVTQATITPAVTYETNQAGQIVKGFHPDKKDIELTVMLHNVSCTANTTCFYNQTQTFMIGSEFWLDSGKTFVGEECSVETVELLNP